MKNQTNAQAGNGQGPTPAAVTASGHAAMPKQVLKGYLKRSDVHDLITFDA